MARLALQESDDAMLQQTAYHLQQAVEKALKYCYLHFGLSLPKTHDVSALIDGLGKVYTLFPADLQESLELRADTLTMWEEKTRYPNDYMATRKSIENMLPVVDKLLTTVTNLCVAKSKSKREPGTLTKMDFMKRKREDT